MRSRQFKKDVGPLFHAAEVFQVRRSKVYPKKTAWLTRHVGKRDSTRLSWRECLGCIQKDSPNMIKGLTQYQIIEKTHQSKKERMKGVKFAGRKDR